MNIKVSNIDPTTTEEDLLQLFEEFGDVVSVFLKDEPDPGKDTYSAIIEMEYESDAEVAIEELNGERIDGRFLEVRAVSARQAEAEIDEGYSGDDDADEEDWGKAGWEPIERKKPREGSDSSRPKGRSRGRR